MVLRWSGDFHDIISITNPTSCYFSRRRFSRHFRSVKQVILLMNIVISRQLISRQTKHQVPQNWPDFRYKKVEKGEQVLHLAPKNVYIFGCPNTDFVSIQFLGSC